MADCSISFAEYFAYQEAIKHKLQGLKDECPREVLNYLLKRESISRMNRVIDCSYTDTLDKKRYIEYTKLDSCKSLRTIL
jgi:hypothetical protein